MNIYNYRKKQFYLMQVGINLTSNKIVIRCKQFLKQINPSRWLIQSSQILQLKSRRHSVNDMKRKFIHLMAAIINETGINITDESLNSKVFRYLFITTPVIYAIFALFMYSYTNRENFYEVVSTATYIGGGTIAIAGVAIIFFHRKDVRQMLYQMDDNIFTYPDEHLIVVNYKWYLKEENGVSLYYLVMAIEFIGYSIICSTSVIEWIFYRDITFYVFPSWTPWKETGIETRFATLISQHIMTLCGLYLYYIGLLFIMIITIEFNRQFERLKSAVRSITKRTGAVTLERRNKKFIPRGRSSEVNVFRDVNHLHSRFDAEFTTEFNKVFKKNLLNCIRHHQLLIT